MLIDSNEVEQILNNVESERKPTHVVNRQLVKSSLSGSETIVEIRKRLRELVSSYKKVPYSSIEEN